MPNLVAMTNEAIVVGRESIFLKLLAIPLLLGGLFPLFYSLYFIVGTFPFLLAALLLLGYQMEMTVDFRHRTLAGALTFFQIPFPFALAFVPRAKPLDQESVFLWRREKHERRRVGWRTPYVWYRTLIWLSSPGSELLFFTTDDEEEGRRILAHLEQKSGLPVMEKLPISTHEPAA